MRLKIQRIHATFDFEVKMNWEIQEILSRLKTQDECQRLEAKETKSSIGKSILESISAFSNEPGLGGGYIVLGLKQCDSPSTFGRYFLAGIQNLDKIQCELASACRNEFNILIQPEIKVEIVNRKALIVVFIPEVFVRDKPVYIKSAGVEKGSFRRIGPTDHKCTEEDLDLLYQLRRQLPFESEILTDTTWTDISLEAIENYRKMRSEVDAGARELKLDDQQLLLSLGVVKKKNNNIIPTIAGLLLFGNKLALRRLMPMQSRIDYILVEGSKWVPDPSKRYHSIEYREALVTVMARIHSQIMGDLPNRFLLKTGQLQRSDSPSIPRDVIREALSNALMHRDYRVNQPVQIIRYSNRIEFHNPGYSLKPFEDFGQSGSLTRNGKIAAVFHDLNLAETKGTGIVSMRTWMKDAGLTTPPLIETDRDGNKFNILLLPHHLLDEADLKWLVQFKSYNLTEADMRILVLAREVGAITNQDYRQINGINILKASSALRNLRDLGLLSMKGAGTGTYYKLMPCALSDKYIEESLTQKLSQNINSLTKGLSAIPSEFPPISDEVAKRLIALGPRSRKEEIKYLIIELCILGPLQLIQLAKILDRDPRYLRDNYLSKMIKNNELVYQFPNQAAHPLQAYKVLNQDKNEHSSDFRKSLGLELIK